MLVNPKNYNHTAKSLKGHTLKKRIEQTSNQLILNTINKEDNIKAIEFCNTLTSSVAQMLLKTKKEEELKSEEEEETGCARRRRGTKTPNLFAKRDRLLGLLIGPIDITDHILLRPVWICNVVLSFGAGNLLSTVRELIGRNR